jgi:hypothetical protein
METEGRIVLWRPTIAHPIVFDCVSEGLCDGPGFWHILLVWLLTMLPQCV